MEGLDSGDYHLGRQLNPEEVRKRTELKRVMAAIIGFMVVILSILFAFELDQSTGAVSINPTIIFWGIVIGVLVYLGLTFQRKQDGLLRLRFCVNCGRNIPFDGVVCPYCRYDYEKNQDVGSR